MKTRLACLLFALSFVFPCAPAQDVDRLRGIRGMSVIVNPFPEEAESDGLMRASMQTDAEIALRKAGIKVDEKFATKLRVTIFAYKAPTSDIYSVSIDVSVIEPAFLKRNPSIPAIATTWAMSSINSVPSRRLRDVREMAGDLIDRFINDFLKANPK